MSAQELASYAIGCAFDNDDVCFLCGRPFGVNEEALLVPEDCEQQARAAAGEPYGYRLAHRRCMERVP